MDEQRYHEILLTAYAPDKYDGWLIYDSRI